MKRQSRRELETALDQARENVGFFFTLWSETNKEKIALEADLIDAERRALAARPAGTHQHVYTGTVGSEGFTGRCACGARYEELSGWLA